MKSASSRSNYRFNPCKRRRPSFDENTKNNNSPTSTKPSVNVDSVSKLNENLDKTTRSSSLTRRNSIENDHSSAINPPLSFDSSLKVCIEKIRTDLIFNLPEVTTSIKDVTRHLVDDRDVTDVTHSVTNDTVTPSCNTEESMDFDDTKADYLLYDTIPHSTPAEKEARRAKRRLQIEQWRQYELNRARNERYHNRLKRKHGISFANPSHQQKTIKWKKDLVQIFLVECDTHA